VPKPYSRLGRCAPPPIHSPRAAARDPRDPAHWYNLGATLDRAGADGKAIAAWTRAARLAPRDMAIRRALRLLPAPDPVTEQLTRVGWATPAEWRSSPVPAGCCCG